jgi:hypothetical protein
VLLAPVVPVVPPAVIVIVVAVVPPAAVTVVVMPPAVLVGSIVLRDRTVGPGVVVQRAVVARVVQGPGVRRPGTASQIVLIHVC